MAAILCAIFFASGCSALIFETLWFQQAGLAFGNSVWASSLVLAGFMAGLAIGNALAARVGERLTNPLRVYAIAELAIAITGVGLVYLFPALGALLAPVLRPLLDRPLLLNPIRLVFAFTLLLIPSTAMGTTLPLLAKTLLGAEASAKAAARYDVRFGAVLGRLYGWNTLGAVAGVVIGELWLIVAFGIRGTALIAGALNLIVAGAAAWLSRSSRDSDSTSRERPLARTFMVREKRPATPWLTAAFAAGFALLALEVVWFRVLLLIVTADASAFAIMLAVVLAGIAIGGLAAGTWLRVDRADASGASAAVVAFAASALCVMSYAVMPNAMQTFERHLAQTPLEILRVGVPLMLPVSLLSGAFFTLVGAALRASQPSDTHAAGRLTLANTVGAALGSLMSGFVFLPLLGMEQSILAIAALYGVIGAGLAWNAATRGRAMYTGAAACLLGLLAFPSGLMRARILPLPVSRYMSLRNTDDTRAPAVRVAAVREGLNETIQYLEVSALGRPMFHQLLTNAISMADTEYLSRRYMKLFVYWPIAVHPHPTRALLICYGAGSTAKAMTESRDLRSIDVVDISRDVVETSRVVYPDGASDPLRDPRVRVHVEDGRYFLQSTAQQFDIVTAEPPPPTAAGTVNLYTREYFQLIRDRLADGGIATYWLPVHVLSEVSTKAVLRAFCDVFDDCSLWNGSGLQLMMVGTKNARGPITEDRFTQQWRDRPVAIELKRLGFERPEQLGALFIGDASYVEALVGPSPELTDDYPRRINAPGGPDDRNRLMRSLTNSSAARGRFAESAFIKRLWPPRLIEASLPYFDAQQIINIYSIGGQPSLAMVHQVLTQTPLNTPVLWLLGTDWDSQEALAHASPAELADPRMQFHLGVRLLAERSYLAAPAPFSRAEASPQLRSRAFAFRVYALCMAGRLDEAKTLMAARAPEVRGETWEWLKRTFELTN